MLLLLYIVWGYSLLMGPCCNILRMLLPRYPNSIYIFRARRSAKYWYPRPSPCLNRAFQTLVAVRTLSHRCCAWLVVRSLPFLGVEGLGFRLFRVLYGAGGRMGERPCKWPVLRNVPNVGRSVMFCAKVEARLDVLAYATCRMFASSAGDARFTRVGRELATSQHRRGAHRPRICMYVRLWDLFPNVRPLSPNSSCVWINVRGWLYCYVAPFGGESL